MRTTSAMRDSVAQSCDLGKQPHAGEFNGPGIHVFPLFSTLQIFFHEDELRYLCLFYEVPMTSPPDFSSDLSQAGY